MSERRARAVFLNQLLSDRQIAAGWTLRLAAVAVIVDRLGRSRRPWQRFLPGLERGQRASKGSLERLDASIEGSRGLVRC